MKQSKTIVTSDIRNREDNKRNLSKITREENYYKLVTVGNFWSKNYIEYKSNGDSNKTLLTEEYANKVRP